MTLENNEEHSNNGKSVDLSVLGMLVDDLNISVTISDPKMADNPLVYVNKGFMKTTGYRADEVLGKNCRFLQGNSTNRQTVESIKNKVLNKESYTTEILNYKKNGEPFWNELNIFPIFCKSTNQLDYYIGVQKDVTEKKEAQLLLQHNMNLAKKIQTHFLPNKMEEQNMSIDGQYIPCDDLGGDLYYWTKLNATQYAVFILDVMGHGVAASMVGTAIRSTLLDTMLNEMDQGALMQRINDQMHSLFGGIGEVMYFTGISMLIDVKENTIKYVNAGHPPAIYVDSKHHVQTLNSEYPPVGIIPNVKYAESIVSFAPDSRLLLYTDGLLNNIEMKANVENLTQSIINYYKEKDDAFLDHFTKDHLNEAQESDDISVVSIHFR